MKKIILSMLSISVIACSQSENQKTTNTEASASTPAPAKVITGCLAPVVELTTNMGVIDIKLDKPNAPVTVDNFLNYVHSGFYNGKIFHRVIPDFMIQGGGFDKDMHEAVYNAPIKNEANNGLSNKKYTIAMARTANPDSATAQFFINTIDNLQLDYVSPDNQGYAVFGNVIKGTEVVDKISTIATHSNDIYQDIPNITVTIINAKELPCSTK